MSKEVQLRRINSILLHIKPHKTNNIIESNKVHDIERVILDGQNLTTKMLHRIGYNTQIKLDLSHGAWLEVKRSRDMINKILEKGDVKYGLNTGFGNFATVVIPENELQQLQKNLILSHSVGVGRILSVERTRMLFALRLNVLAKGYSGISPGLLRDLIERFNAGLVSEVPEKGTVGASGDLAPLAHLIIGFLGIGKLWNPRSSQWEEAQKVLDEFQFKPVVLGAKEGLALINGTQFIASLGSESVERAKILCKTADVISALTLEVLRGSTHPFEPEIHNARPHSGQIKTAQRILALLSQGISEIQHSHENCSKVQDSYTLRCIPQVHGIVKDTVDFVEKIINTELNSATDNPMVFYKLDKMTSCGNFHGEYPAKALDYLAIGINELANISERRLARLINNKLSELPDFLVEKGGLNSGFMMAQVTAASLVSENKTLCHPASVDTIETSGSKEDHVSMGGWAAVKCLQVIENVENVLAIELLACCQGLEFLRPLKTTEALESVYLKVREFVRPWDEDRFFKPDIDFAKKLINDGTIWRVARQYLTDENN